MLISKFSQNNASISNKDLNKNSLVQYKINWRYWRYQIITNLKRYFYEMLYMPWIWVWGYYIFSTGFMLVLDDTQILEIQKNYYINLNNFNTLWQFWAFVGTSLFVNYTLNFFIKSSTKKLQSLIFSMSALILSVFTIILIQSWVSI